MKGAFDLSKAVKAENKAALMPLISRTCCANCAITYDANSPKQMLVCSACTNSYYCTKECQKEHWKSHKPRCLLFREQQKKAKDEGLGREFRLVQKWKDRVRNGMLGYILIVHFGLETLAKMQEREQFILLELGFDYNKRTFFPKKKPDRLQISALDSINPKHSQSIRDCYRELGSKCKNIHVIVMLQYQSNMSIMPITMESPGLPPAGMKWDDLSALLGQIMLTSSAENSAWLTLCNQNIKTQLDLIRCHSHLITFLSNALRMETNKKQQLYKTHIVCVDMEMGRGLGEIISLTSCHVRPVKDALADFESSMKDRLPPEQIEYYRTHLFDLEQSPILLQSRVNYPHNAFLPVVFVGKSSCIYIMPNLSETLLDQGSLTPAKCDKRARQAFAQLQKVKFPPVVSPPLD